MTAEPRPSAPNATSQTPNTASAPPRVVALVGPYQSGKSALLEAILFATGALARPVAAREGGRLSDGSAEARALGMGVDLAVAQARYLDDAFIFIDCPGSIEFSQETQDALLVADAAIVVTEPDPAKAAMLAPLLHHLADEAIPHFIFVNKIDRASHRLRDVLAALQAVSARPLVLRQIPIWRGGIVTGFVDLASERAYVYHEHAASEVLGALPPEVEGRKAEARYAMLERLADYDDHLLEELLADIPPPSDEIFNDLAEDLRAGLIVPVMIGSAERTNGVRRLLKALRHEAPPLARTRARLGLADVTAPIARAFKVSHAGHGRQVLARVMGGALKDGGTVIGADSIAERAGGLTAPLGPPTAAGGPIIGGVKTGEAATGAIVAIGRLERARAGDILGLGVAPPANAILSPGPPLSPVHAISVAVADAKDEVKATGAIAKLLEEDRALTFTQRAETHDMILAGQGDVHLKATLARLKNRFGVTLIAGRPAIAYRETIRAGLTRRGRHKRQSGGHGQFGDVVLEIAPRPRGSGSTFDSRIVGGVVPKAFIPGIEAGVEEGLRKGPLGFPVVDVAVSVIDGSHHAVDSSDMAFRLAARAALAEALPEAGPILLEPIHRVEIAVPQGATARVNALIAARRGQILGFDARVDWPGWDLVRALMPEAELQGLIVEIRSASQGVGTYASAFDHLAELTGKPAELVLSAHRAA